MFNVKIELPLNNKTEDKLHGLIHSDLNQDHLKLSKKNSQTDYTFRYIMDSRLGVVFVRTQRCNKKLRIEIKESIRGIIPIIFLLLSGIISLFFSKLKLGLGLTILSFVYLYIVYFNFKIATKDISNFFSE